MPPLTWNADRRTLSGGRLETTFGVKWRNYLTDSGWSAIDLTPRQVSTDWVFDRAPYALTLPSLANGWATFESTNKYDIHSKTVMPDAKCGIQKRYSSAIAVPGVPELGGIRFLGAFPSLNAHRLVQTHEQKIRDLIVFTSEPPGNGPVEVPIEIDFGSLPMLESTGREKSPKESNFRADKDVAMGLSFTTGTFRGVQIKQPFAWDSAGKRTPIKLRGKVVGSRFVGSKVIPRSVFSGATYPVYADTTSTFYPDPDTETTSVDGYAQRYGSPGTSWADKRGGNGTETDAGAAADQTSPWIGGSVGAWTVLRRNLYVFDTSSLGSGSTITAGVFSLHTDFASASGDQNFVVTPATTASNTAIAASDYQSNTSSTVYATITDAAVTSGYNDWTLDAAGRSNISKTGVSKFAMKLSGDASNTEPSGQSSDRIWKFADYFGTGSDPKLVVTYTSPFTATAALSITKMTMSSSSTFTAPPSGGGTGTMMGV